MVIVVEPSLSGIKLFIFKNKSTMPVFISFSGIEDINEPKKLRDIVFKHAGHKKIDAISFKMHFGGDIFAVPQKVDDIFLVKLEGLVDFFPMYILFATSVIKLFLREFKNVPIMAFFETSFFCRLPDSERYYALPHDFHAVSGIKKWGFHGIYHQANGMLAKNGEKVVSIVLDTQTTVCAIQNGKPYSISLGCTPLEGVMSRTCCGDIDPGIVFYLLKEHKLSTFKLDSILKNESGFLGMTGYDLTFGELMTLYGRDKKVTLAFDTYEAQILKYIGECAAVLGGVNRIFFSGCYTDVLTQVIYDIVKNISFLGTTLKSMPWDRRCKKEDITLKGSEIQIVINRTLLPEIVFQNTLIEQAGFKRR